MSTNRKTESPAGPGGAPTAGHSRPPLPPPAGITATAAGAARRMGGAAHHRAEPPSLRRSRTAY